MNCSKCGVENPDSAKFCIECAAPFGRKCPSCGAENPPRAKFCAQCSIAIEALELGSQAALRSDHRAVRVAGDSDSARADGERKTVIAMLADIYNWFTEGFETADLKDAKALLDELGS